MRTALLAAAVALLGTACYSESTGRYYRHDDRDRMAQQQRVAPFDAYTTSGDFVRVAQERDGDLVILEPSSMRGMHVALVNQDPGNGTPLVTTDVRRAYPYGSGGDRP
jgi:hypothetical protein